MDLDVKFMRMSNGARLAYATIGRGSPLVFAPASMTHLGATWENLSYRRALESLAETFTVLVYDRWGNGLSDRNRTDWTLDAEVDALAELVTHLEWDRFAAVGISGGGPALMLYASRNAGRLSHLVLYASYARVETDPEWLQGVAAFVRGSWGMGARALSEIFVPDQDPEHLAWFLKLEREAADGDTAAKVLTMEVTADVRAIAGGIEAPTLVIHRRNDGVVPFENGRELAAEIPGARLLALAGDQHYWFRGDFDAIVRAIKDFAGGPDALPPDVGPTLFAPGAVQTILFTDLEGHTAMMSRLGDARGREVLREHERRTRAALAAHGGQEIKTMGDGFMASFQSAQRALECAANLQRVISEMDKGEGELRLRVGINAGEPIAEEDDLFGTSVIVAARIAAKAAGGQVLVADVVRQLSAGKGFLFSDTGEHVLKGLEEPVRIWELRWDA